MVFLLSGFKYSISKMFHSFYSYVPFAGFVFLLKGQTLKERSPCWEVVSNVHRVVMTSPEFPWVHLLFLSFPLCDSHLLFESLGVRRHIRHQRQLMVIEQSWASAKYGKATLFCWKFMAQNGSRIYTTQHGCAQPFSIAFGFSVLMMALWQLKEWRKGIAWMLSAPCWELVSSGIFRLEAATKHHETPGIVQWTSWFDFEVKDVYHANKETRHYKYTILKSHVWNTNFASAHSHSFLHPCLSHWRWTNWKKCFAPPSIDTYWRDFVSEGAKVRGLCIDDTPHAGKKILAMFVCFCPHDPWVFPLPRLQTLGNIRGFHPSRRFSTCE